MKYPKKYCLVLCCLSIPQLRSRLVIEMERGLGADAFITLLEASAPLSRKDKIERGKVELPMCASQKKKPDLMQSRCVLNKCGAGVGVDTTKSIHLVLRKFTFLSLKCRGLVDGVTDLGLPSYILSYIVIWLFIIPFLPFEVVARMPKVA